MDGQGVIPDDWTGEYCRYAVCWPNSPQWLAVLRGVLTLPASGRFWDKYTGEIKPAQLVIKETFDVNLHLQEVIMACGDAQLSQIAAALRLLAQNQCCGDAPPSNGGIQIIINSPMDVPTPVYGSEPPGSLEPETVPPDYPGTLEEYDADKCRTSAMMITGWITTLRNLSYIGFAQTTGLIALVLAALAGAIVLPVFLIPILIAAAIGVVGVNAALVALADGMQEEFDELVCILYESDNAQTIIGRLSDAMDAIISAIPVSGALALAVKTIALVLMNTDTLNALFTMSQGQGPAYECDCGECDTFFDFAEDLQGWFVQTDNGTGTDLSWDDGFMRATYGSGTSPGARLQSPDIDYVVQAGDHFVWQIQPSDGAPYTLFAWGIIGGSEEEIIFANTSGNESLSVDLTSFVGQTVQAWRVYTARSGAQAGWYTRNDGIGVVCS